MHKSFLQTHSWLSFQKAAGRKIWHFNDGTVEAGIIKHDLPFGKSYLYIPQGPDIHLRNAAGGFRNAVRDFANFVDGIAKKENAIFVKMEPLYDTVSELLHTAGLPLYKGENIQPNRTAVIDLKLSKDELLGKMHHKLRYNIGLAERKGLTFAESDDFEAFWELLAQTAKEDKFHTHPKRYYEKMLAMLGPKKSHELVVRLFFIRDGGLPIAGAIVLEYGKFVYYLHGAMDRTAKTLMAPPLLHWNIIKNYQKAGAAYYDFWGIDSKKWPGVTRFKLSFGGKTVEYPGAFDMPVSKLWYMAYKLARRIL